MVMWCICDIYTILISLRINDVFCFVMVCSTYLTMVAWCEQLEELSVLISFTQQFVFQSCIFFSTGKAVYCCLAIFPVMVLCRLQIVTEVVIVELEWNFLCPRCQTSPRGLLVWITWLFLLFFLGYNFGRYSTYNFYRMKNVLHNSPLR